MELSLFLAKLIGLYLVIVCLAVLYNRDLVASLVREMGSNTFVLIFSGTIHLVLGLLVVLSHNIWSADWRGLITLIGWITLVKGMLRLFFPQKVQRWAAHFVAGNKHLIIDVIFLVIGIYLTFIGFIYPLT